MNILMSVVPPSVHILFHFRYLAPTQNLDVAGGDV